MLCLVAFGFAYAPRVAQVTVGGIGLVCMVVLVAMMALLFMISPEKMDLWFAFLKPLGIAIWLLLPAVAVVSIAGWVRYCRKASRGVSGRVG